MLRILPFILITITLLTGCRNDIPEVIVYSDSPEIVILVNLFNQTQEIYKARFIYGKTENAEQADPGASDVVLMKSLHNAAYKNRMRSLEQFRASAGAGIYPSLLRTGIENTTLKSIPLSLDIPMVISKKQERTGKYKSWEEMRLIAEEYNEVEEDRLKYSGFSPLWSDSFLGAWFHSRVSSYAEMIDEADFSEIDTAVSGLVQWIEEANGGLAKDRAFSDKYRYIPDYRLVIDGRTAYTVMPLSEWALLPDSISRELDATPLVIGEGLLCLSILSAGLPEDSENPEGGEAFMEWLLKESSWEDFIKISTRNRDEVFGLMGGLSASEKFNVNKLPQYYPAVGDWIPRSGEFAAQPDIPAQWDSSWDELFLPLIKEKINGSDEDIAEAYRKWLLLNPVPWSP